MSYEKVKSIKIDEKNGKVFINCASNNVRPLTYSNEEYPYFSNILRESGRDAVEVALLKSYEEGNLQQGENKFTRALRVLRYVFKEEYARFDWRLNRGFAYGSEEYKKERALRDSEEFKQLLLKALKTPFPKEQFVITKNYGSQIIYGKACPTCMKWTYNPEKATKFAFEEEAKDHIYNSYKDQWQVTKI